MANKNLCFRQLVNDIGEYKKFVRKKKDFIDGYALDRVGDFHKTVDKNNAVDIIYSDDRAIVTVNGTEISVGEDDKKVYLMAPNPVGCVVEFNSSCYLF